MPILWPRIRIRSRIIFTALPQRSFMIYLSVVEFCTMHKNLSPSCIVFFLGASAGAASECCVSAALDISTGTVRVRGTVSVPVTDFCTKDNNNQYR
jgi:hypothetical protein